MNVIRNKVILEEAPEKQVGVSRLLNRLRKDVIGKLACDCFRKAKD